MNSHAKMALKAAKSRWGKGWSQLSGYQRDSAVCYEIVMIMLGQADETLARNPALDRLMESAQQALMAVEGGA